MSFVVAKRRPIAVFLLLFGIMGFGMMAGCQNKEAGTEPSPPEPTNVFTASPTWTITQTFTAQDTQTFTLTPTNTPTYTLTATLTVTATPSVTPTSTPCFVFGNLHNSSNAMGGRIYFQKYTAAGANTITRIYYYSPYAGSAVSVGVYADSGGCPGALLISSGPPEVIPQGWNSISVSDYPVTAGDYWLAVSSILAVGIYNDQGASPAMYYLSGAGTLPGDMAGVCPSNIFSAENYKITMFASCQP